MVEEKKTLNVFQYIQVYNKLLPYDYKKFRIGNVGTFREIILVECLRLFHPCILAILSKVS